jgi:hypothetical protein
LRRLGGTTRLSQQTNRRVNSPMQVAEAMATNPNRHSYQAIDRSKDEIRVLCLLPGKADAPIIGELLLIEIGSKTPYNTLSYMWGDAKLVIPIEIDGDRLFMVTRNAEAALRDLRSEHQALLIWVDVICIDQRNVAERNHQVKLMQKIYQHAHTVHTWLNHAIEANEPAFEKLAAFEESTTIADLGDDPSFWTPVAAISNNEYWTRVWIQQEVAFAQRLVIHCREHVINSETLLRFQQLVAEKQEGTRQDPTKSVWHSIRMYYADLSGLDRDRPGVHRQRDDKTGHRYANLIEALSLCEHLASANPRDRVYAVLSLVEGNLAAQYDVNYALTVAEVYTGVARFVLARYNSLGFLIRASKTYKKTALPTWVPDWSCVCLSAPGVSASQLVMSCTSEQGPQYSASISSDLRRLTAYGVRIDTLSTVYPNATGQDNIEFLED